MESGFFFSQAIDTNLLRGLKFNLSSSSPVNIVLLHLVLLILECVYCDFIVKCLVPGIIILLLCFIHGVGKC